MKNILYLLSIMIGLYQPIAAQTTAIPDANFEAKLISLGIDSDGLVNGQILDSDAAAVTGTLRVSSSNISDLTGIQSFVNISSIICDSNQISTINVSNLSIVQLWCGHNQITNIVLPTAGTITNFVCVNNQLTGVNVSGQLNLSTFWCANNQMTGIYVGLNTVLESLVCENNNLTTLDVTNNPLLRNLSCSNNQISSIDLTNNSNLHYLVISNNPLNGVFDVTNNTALISLSCNGIGLTSIDVSNLSSLQYLYVSDNQLTALDVSNNLDLRQLGISDNQITSIDLSDHIGLSGLYCTQNRPFLRICVRDLSFVRSVWEKDLTAIYTTGCGTNAVQVQVVIDSNNNCLVESNEPILSNQIVKFERQSDGDISYFSTYGNTGTYPFYIDTGMYIVSVVSTHPYWQLCSTNQVFTVDTTISSQQVSFSIQPTISCPYLTVDIAAPFLRMTGGGSAYTVSYCNTGTATAQNAYVEVDLDNDLNYVSATLPLISQVGSRYRFDIGNVPAGQCGSFDIQTVVDTSSLIGQTHCTQVHIYPDSLCLPSFNLPTVSGEVNCQNDTVLFRLENTGVTMSQTHQYEIFEDNIAMRGGVIQLNNGQTMLIAQAANMGKTYRIEVDQSPNYPAILGDAVFSLTTEGCRPNANGEFNTGFVTQFSNGLSQPTQAIDCQQNIAAYDPNDKAAQPAGYDNQHYIYANIAIDYKIRFQNTGNDTAFNIVILDTLSPLVDIGSLTMGASSHAYNWSIQDGNVLRVDFQNIMLVDSNANEPLSHGFFRYRIAQQPNNALGSVIYNQAAIYFDYNPPIFTNTTFHTIGDNFVTNTYLTLDKVSDDALNVTTFPNPFQTSTTIAIEGKMFDKLEVQVFDLLGRQVSYQQARQSDRVELQRGKLEQGFYVFQLIGDGELLSTGKLKVE